MPDFGWPNQGYNALQSGIVISSLTYRLSITKWSLISITKSYTMVAQTLHVWWKYTHRLALSQRKQDMTVFASGHSKAAGCSAGFILASTAKCAHLASVYRVGNGK